MANQQESVEELFGAALERSPEERASFLDRACAGDDRLREHVEDLLHAHESAGDFLENPMALFAAEGLDASAMIAAVAKDSHESFPPPTLARFAPGQLIGGRFTVVRFIAHGGMGEVYEVDDQLLQGAHVALKAILPHIAADAALSQRFQQEVLLARKVTHPNLCPIYDIARCQDTQPPFVFLTMKLLSGQTLADRIRAPEPIPLSEVAAIFRQMTAGLTAIHAANVVHGDIKPNNVMLDGTASEVRLSIMDFGLARLHEAGHTLLTRGPIAGTLGYLAPEILRGGQPTQATDLYALGVLLHKLLTGETPDAVHSNDSTALSPALAAADVPPALIGFVRQLLADDPAIRQRAFAEMQAYFGQISLTSAMPFTLSLADPPRRPLLTRRTFALGSALTVCAAGAAGIAWNRDLLDDVLHPLPRKRFVSLIGWPPTADAKLKPMLMSLIELIGNELARAEAFDHDLYVVPHVSAAEVTTPAQINNIRESAGANLVLAASGVPAGDDFHLKLEVLDSNPNHVLRTKQLRVPTDQQDSLRNKSVRLAADLLDVRHYAQDTRRLSLGSDNPQAIAAFQTAEAARKKPNDTGLDAALEKFKEAVELDPRFALAYAQLAYAYLRYYIVRHEPAALHLSQANSETALSLSPSLVEGHLARSGMLDRTGDRAGALRELRRALELDPANERSLALYGDTLTRSNRWEEAEQIYVRLLRARPNHWLGHLQLGDLYSLTGRYADAATELRVASLARPSDAFCLSDLATVLREQGKLPEAAQAAQRSLGMAANSGADVVLAQVLRSQNKFAEAAQFAEKATGLDPDDPQGWLELADCCGSISAQKGRSAQCWQKVAELQREALAIDTADGQGWMLLALAAIKTGSVPQGLELMKRAESTFADDVESQLIKARILTAAGRREEALATLERCRNRGATAFQLETTPDLNPVRSDARYKQLVRA